VPPSAHSLIATLNARTPKHVIQEGQ